MKGTRAEFWLRLSIASGFGLDTSSSKDIRTQNSHFQRQIPSLELCSLTYPKLKLLYKLTTTSTTTTIMSSSAADAAAGLGLDPEYLKFAQLISSPATLSAVPVSSNIKLDNVKVLKLSVVSEL
jgi:hypothetical protein